jgi:PBP4 family serine-type D-alanyl-D-alanine carboxypeptidase
MIKRLAAALALIIAVVTVVLLGGGAHSSRPLALADELVDDGSLTLARSDSLAIARGFDPLPVKKKAGDKAEDAPAVPVRVDSVHRAPLSSDDSARALEQLANDIRALVKLPAEMKAGRVGIEIRSLTADKVLFSMNADKPLTPASTTKVVTSFTALSELGPNYMVRTVVSADARPTRDGMVKGNLYVKCCRNPFLSVNEIDTLVEQIVNSGVRQVEGNIVGDGSFFDNKTERTQYSGDADVVVPLPPIAALTVGQSVFSVVISSPRASGEPLNVQTFPHSSGFEIVNNAVSVAPRVAPKKARSKKGATRKGKRRSDAILPDAPADDGLRYGDESPSNYETVVGQRKPSKKATATASKSGAKTTQKSTSTSKNTASAKKTAKSAPATSKTAAAKTSKAKAPAKAAAVKPATAKSEPSAETVVNRGPLKVSLSTGENGKQIITVTGSLPTNRTVSYRYQMKNPPQVIAGMVYDRLRSHGITIAGQPVSGVAPARSRVLAETGRPLVQILQLVMKNSNNFLAEYVFKMIGAAAGGQQETARKTQEKIQHRMTINQVNFNKCIINDGSGLSRANCLSASALDGILTAAYHDRKVFDPLYSTMSIAGVDGTLKGRMKGTFAQGNVHGKTGTLRNASALAGYVTTRDGELLCFSMLMNGGNHGSYRAVQDRIAARLAAFSYSGTLATLDKAAK